MDATGSGPGSGWRSEEDYLFARLANEHGYLQPTAVDGVLRRQRANAEAGLPLTFSQVVTRDGLLTGEALLHVKRELARCEHRCPGCGIRRYLVPGPEPREEPCLRCSAPIPVSVTGSTVSDTQTRRRQAAINEGSRADGLAARRLEPSSEELLPRHFGSYTLVSLLAKGAMGAVYRGRDTGGAPVAVKMLLAGAEANAAQRHRFRREAKAQSALAHPHIASVRDAGEVDGVPYQVMDLVTGGDLARGYADLTQGQRVTILAKVARAIEHAHREGYIHRDLKLANVLLTEAGEPKVTDFGLTKHLEGHTRLTQDGAVVGTPFYMSPEQVTGRVDDIGTKSDVYALGVMLYELTTGSLPFVAESSVELARMILEMRPASFAEKGVLAPQLEVVAFRALEKDPELRYVDAGAFALDLERIGRGEDPVAGHVGAAERVARQVQRHRRSLGLLVAGTAVGLTVLIGVALGLRSYRTGVQRERAERLCTEALGALETGLQGAPWGAPPAPETEAVLLSAQDALDDPSVSALPVAEADALRARLRLGMLNLARRHLRSGTNAGARRTLELIVDADAAQDPAAASLAARAAIRLGQDPEPALKSLGEGPEQARLRGLLLLLGGAPTRALALLPAESALEVPFERAEARAWHAVALVGAGRAKAGRALLATLRAEAKEQPETLRRLNDLATLAGIGPAGEVGSSSPVEVELAARAAALRADGSADDELEALVTAIVAEDPRDLVPASALAKAMRDAAWALRAQDLRDVDPRVAALAERALRRRSRDLDLLLLRQKLDPARHAAALKAAAKAALLDLSSPLGRGMVLSRLAAIHSGPMARRLGG